MNLDHCNSHSSFKDKVEIDLGINEQQTIYFQSLVNENTSETGRTNLSDSILNSFLVNQRRKEYDLVQQIKNWERKIEIAELEARRVRKQRQRQGAYLRATGR